MSSHPTKIIYVSPYFKLVLGCIFILTIVSLCVSFYLSGDKSLTDEAKKLIGVCTTCYQMGFGAIIGLLGGKAL